MIIKEINNLLGTEIPKNKMALMSLSEYQKAASSILKSKFDIMTAADMNHSISSINPRGRIRLRQKLKADDDFTHYALNLLNDVNAGNNLPDVLLDFTTDDIVKLKQLPQTLTLAQVKSECDSITLKLSNYIRYLIHKKLRFIIASNNHLDFEDLESRIILITYTECKNSIMSKRGLHLINYLKQKINSAVLNIIGEYSTGKRNTLEKSKDSNGNVIYTSKKVNQIIHNDEGEDLNVFDKIGDDRVDFSYESLNNRLSFFFKLKTLQKEKNKSNVKYRLMQVISNDSPEFVKFFNEENDSKFTDPLDIIQYAGKLKFMKALKKFIGVPKMEMLHSLLNEYKNEFKEIIGL